MLLSGVLGQRVWCCRLAVGGSGVGETEASNGNVFEEIHATDLAGTLIHD